MPWSRLYKAVVKFARRFDKTRRHLSWTDWRRCPHCGRFMCHEYVITTRHRVVFEDKVYVGTATDVYNKHYRDQVHWAPNFIMHPHWVFWCPNCSYIVLMPDLEAVY